MHFTGSKMDQFRQGDEVVVARTGSRTCPVTMLEHFMAVNNMSPDDQRYIFRQLQRTKNGESLRETGWISDTCIRELFNKKIAALGFPAHKFGLHSLRTGGATAAANARLPFQKAWKMEA